MEDGRDNLSGLRYYWEYIKRFGKESADTWWKDFVIAIAPTGLTIALGWGDRTAVQTALLAVEAIGIFFAVVALRHLVHTSFLLFRERAHPEFGGVRYTHWGYGVWGVGILMALAVGSSYAVSHRWLRKPPPIVLNLPAPKAPTITVVQQASPPNNAIAHDSSISKPPAQTAAARPPTPSVASQAAPQVPVTRPSPPATFLDRVVRENRGLTPDDRNRLSTELYECDQFVKQSRAVGREVDRELAEIENQVQHRSLQTSVNDDIKRLRQLGTLAQDQYHGLALFQAKYRYFPDQTEYVFGDNPFNAGEGFLESAVNGMANALAPWSKISSRDQQEMIAMEGQRLIDCQNDLRKFFVWTNETLQRIKQMRQSLDPNGVVQPIPSNTVAPGVPAGMFM